jgi:hypothetical protein
MQNTRLDYMQRQIAQMDSKLSKQSFQTGKAVSICDIEAAVRVFPCAASAYRYFLI